MHSNVRAFDTRSEFKKIFFAFLVVLSPSINYLNLYASWGKVHVNTPDVKPQRIDQI